MVRSYQHAFELHQAGVQGSLTGGEEVSLASAFLSGDLLLLYDFAMLPLE